MAAASRTRSRSAAPQSPVLNLAQSALEDMKAVNIKVLDVRGLTDIADTLIVASGNSDRHVRSIAEHVVQSAKAAGHRPYGVEGARDGEWALVDLHDVIVHVMLPRVREFYGLEALWDQPATAPADKKPAAKKKAPVRKKAPAAKAAGSKSTARRPATRAARKPKA